MKQEAAEIIREYGPFPGVEAVHGVSFDGKQVWFASGDRLITLDPDSGEIANSFDFTANAGTAFDGTHIYQISEGAISKIDMKTGAQIASIPAPGGEGASGLTWAEGSLWVGQCQGRKIHQVNPETGEVIRMIESDRFVTGVTWIDKELWHGTWSEDESDIRRIDAETGDVLERLDMPSGIGVSGLEYDGHDRFYCGGGNSGKIRVVRRPG